MKSALLFGLSALLTGLAAKPFVDASTRPEATSWAAFRSYPYGAKADAAMAAGRWSVAADFYAAAIARNPGEGRYARGLFLARAQLHRRVSPSQRLPDILAANKPAVMSQHVKYDIPATAAERAQQTPWRGPIVSLATSSPVVPFQSAPETQPENPRVLLAMADAPPAPQGPQAPLPQQVQPLAILSAPRWSVTSSATVRGSALALGAPGVSGFGGSQSGAELRWRLNADDARPLQIAAATFVGMSHPLSFDDRSAQAVIGLRYKPFAHINALVGADRLIKIGPQARNAFALRFMADTGANYDGPVDRTRWLHWHAGVDTALIGIKSRDIYAGADTRVGMGFRVNDQISVTPYLGANAILQAAGTSRSLVEIGPGIWLRGTINDRSRVDFRLAYRFNVAGNAPSRNGLVAQVALGF